MASKKIDYKVLCQQLDDVIVKMQDDTTSVDEMLQLYEEGIRLTRELEDHLQEADNKLKTISESARNK